MVSRREIELKGIEEELSKKLGFEKEEGERERCSYTYHLV